MIREQVRIVSISAGRMHLAPLAGGCGSCASAAGCGSARLARLLPAGERQLVLPAQSGRRVGEVLEVEMPETALLSAAAIAYLPPLLGLVAGALLTTPLAEGLQPLGALLGTVAGFAASRLIARADSNRFTPVPLESCGSPQAPLSLPQESHHD